MRADTETIDLRGRGLTGDVAEVALESAGIMTNRNVIPFDPGTPDRPQRGMRPDDMAELAALIDAALRSDDPASLGARSRSLAARFPITPAR